MMRGRGGALVVLLLASAASGCLGASVPDDADVLVLPPYPALEFLPETRVSTLASATRSETFVDVSGDGSVILTCQNGEMRSAPMYASVDGGATFQSLDSDPPSAAGWDCDVALGDDGTWYFVHHTLTGVTVAATSDQGASWNVDLTAGGAGTEAPTDRPWIASGGPTTVLVWMPPIEFGTPGPAKAAISTDQGATWTEGMGVSSAASGIIVGKPLVSADGQTIHVPVWHGDFEGELATSLDGGATWVQYPVVGPASPGFDPPFLTRTPDGGLHWVYHTAEESGRAVMILSSGDGGLTWNGPRTIMAGFENLGRMWIGARPDGTIDVLLQGDGSPITEEAQAGSLMLLRVVPESTPMVLQSAVLATGGGEFVGLAHDSSGHAAVAFIRRVAPAPGATDGLFIIRERAETVA